jgi:hypothetical protein
MTSDNTEALEVTQADRDAAAALLLADYGDSFSPEYITATREGRQDHGDYVQAFARHRTRYTPPTDAAEELSTGDTFKAAGATYVTAGINVDNHYNRIECYGRDEDDAEALRDRILAALRYTPTPVENEREALRQAVQDLLTVGNDYPGSSCQQWCTERARAAWSVLEPWRHCPSTHCERRQECSSVNECSASAAAIRSRPSPAQVADGGEK